MQIERSLPEIDTGPLADGIDSPTAKLVYLYLSATRGCTVDRLHDDLGLKRLDLFAVLETLDERGYVTRRSDTYVPERA